MLVKENEGHAKRTVSSGALELEKITLFSVQINIISATDEFQGSWINPGAQRMVIG